MNLLQAWRPLLFASAVLGPPISATAEPAPVMPLPPCEMVNGQERGACPRTSPEIRMMQAGRFGAGVTLTFTPDTVPACTSNNGRTGEWTPSPCYRRIRPLSISPSCSYIDLRDGEFKTSPCATLLYTDSSTAPPRLFTYESDIYSFRAQAVETVPRCGAEGDFATYIYGGPASDPNAVWGSRGVGALPCRATFAGPRPDGLYGPTWVRVTATVEIIETGSNGRGAQVDVFVPIDGDLRPLGEVEMTLVGTEMDIVGHRGAASETLTHGLVTEYGKTFTPFDLEVTKEGQPFEGADVTVEVVDLAADAARLVGLSTTRGSGLGNSEIRVQSGPEGKVRVWMTTDGLYQAEEPPASLRVVARIGGSEDSETIAVVDNLSSLVERYEQSGDIPDGARNGARDGLRPPISDLELDRYLLRLLVSGGNGNSHPWWEADDNPIFCSVYQHLTLAFLNRIRHDADDAWLVNGLDYGPVQTVDTDHHYVLVYPLGELETSYEEMRIFDPWPSQQSTVYTFDEYTGIPGALPFGPDISTDPVGTGTCLTYCGMNTVPNYYPTNGGPYPYFTENESLPIAQHLDACLYIPRGDWCARHNLTGRADKPVAAQPSGGLAVGSPAVFHLDYPDGRAYGYATPETFVNDFPVGTTGRFRVPEAGDETGWWVDLPAPGPFRLTMTATGTGSMTVALVGPNGLLWGTYANVPIVTGQVFTVDVDFAAACAPMIGPDGSAVPCACADANGDGALDACPAVVAPVPSATPAPAPEEASSGCVATRVDASSVFLFAGMVAVGALMRRRRRR